jgi:hypothetical protein
MCATAKHGVAVRTTETGKAIMVWTGGYNGIDEAHMHARIHPKTHTQFWFDKSLKKFLEILKNCRITYICF